MKRLADIATVIIALVAVAMFVDSRRSTPTPAGTSLEGQRLDQVSAIDSNGGREVLPLRAESRQLLLIFSETCPVCRTQREDWMGLRAIAEPLGVATVAVGVGPDPLGSFGYFSDGTKVLVPESGASAVGDWGIRHVPTTLLLEGGEVVFHGAGLLSKPDLERLRSMMPRSP